jgi:hypothetical protein
MHGVKLTFIFTPKPSLAETPPEERVRTSITLPDGVKSRDDLRDVILKIANNAAYFTQYSLFVNCPEGGLRNEPVLQREPASFHASTNAVSLHFEGILMGGRFWKKSKLYLYAPITPPFQNLKTLFRLDYPRYSVNEQHYIEHMRAFVEPLIELLNSTGDQWTFAGFEPRRWQNRQAKRLNKLGAKRRKEAAAAERKQKRLEEKIAAQAAKSKAQEGTRGPSTHGAGRVPGARPGIYKGVQMRSQLEINFASELDDRSIKWVYEGEALGDAQYLVDFYLPDLDVWVEVKGQLSAKDRQVLPDVAKTLKIERRQRLLMYSGSGHCYVINPSGFREIKRERFWVELLK